MKSLDELIERDKKRDLDSELNESLTQVNMTKSFDDILDGSVKFGDSQRVCFEKGFEAGQQSKQAEVDELQKRIDDALSCADKCTWNIALVELKKILKGNTNDH